MHCGTLCFVYSLLWPPIKRLLVLSYVCGITLKWYVVVSDVVIVLCLLALPSPALPGVLLCNFGCTRYL